MDSSATWSASDVDENAQSALENPDEITIEGSTDSQDEATMDMLQNELLAHQAPTTPPDHSAQFISKQDNSPYAPEAHEKELAKRHPPTARVGHTSYSSNPNLHPLAGVEGLESTAATPAQTPAPSTYVYESASYSPSFPTTVIYPDDGEPPALSLSPSHPPPSALPVTSLSPAPDDPQYTSMSDDTPVLAPPLAPLVDAAPSSTDFGGPPKSDIERLSDRLSEDPHDGQLWQVYINLVDQSGDMEIVEAAYDRLVETFPNMVRYSPHVQAIAEITTRPL